MKSRFFITVLALLLALPIAYSVQCAMNFDISCPLIIAQCSSDFIGGANCVVEGPSSCKDSGVRTFKITENNSLFIDYSAPVYAIEAFLTGNQGSVATMVFLDADGNAVSSIATSHDCSLSKPSRHQVKFSEAVFGINISVSNGTAYLDTLITNPTSLCSVSDTICDGIDDDCDGLIDENANTTCDNGLFCDGTEFCLTGACQDGTNIDCSANNIAGISTCNNNPDNNPLTLDNRSAFVSVCNENTNSCTLGNPTMTHACSFVCGSQCQSNNDCQPSFMCDLTSCGCVVDPSATPTLNIEIPLNNSLITLSDFSLDFSLINWSITSQGNTHLHFHIDNVPGLSYSDSIEFFNNYLLLDNLPTVHATKIDNDTIQFNNVPDGLHAIRGHLAYGNDSIPSNPEADRFIVVYVNETKCISDTECYDNNGCTHDYCDNSNECQHRNIQNGTISCGIGTCARSIDRCENGLDHSINPTLWCHPGQPSQEICDLLDNNCNGFADEANTCDVSMTIFDPDSRVYDDRRVPFNISVTLQTDYISIIDSTDKNPKEKILCKKCSEYGNKLKKLVSFADGAHNVTFTSVKSAVNETFLDFETISFFVDATPPKILKTEPKRGYARGNFSLEFIEENPISLFLYYGDENLLVEEIDLDDCFETMPGKVGCDVLVDVSGFDGGPISYWFNLSDIAGHYAVSRSQDLPVDVTLPSIEHLNVTVDARKVLFNISVSELVDISVFDSSESRPRWMSLCRNCETYNKDRSFSIGNHTLLVRATDPAGNYDEEEVEFLI